MKLESSTRIPEVHFHRIKTDAVEFVFNFIQEGAPINISANTYKMRFYHAGAMRVELSPLSLLNGTAVFSLSTENKALLTDNITIRLVQLTAGKEKTLCAGELEWGYQSSRASLEQAPEVNLLFNPITAQVSASLGYMIVYRDGASAYDLAVQNGYEGSEEDYVTQMVNLDAQVTAANALYAATQTEAAKAVTYGAAVQNLISAHAWYGVEWNVTAASTAMTRIGSSILHKELPIQSKIRGCVLQDNGTVAYYLHPNNWAMKDNGTPSVLDGTDGQLMVEIPKHYRRHETEGDIRRTKLSEFPLPGYFEVPKFYVSPDFVTVDRTNNKLASVVNNSTQYRGGDNVATNDANPNTFLGKAAVMLTIDNSRTYARARGSKWNLLTYNTHNALAWLVLVEYSTRNLQLAYNATLTSEGFKQGGLGIGATNLDNTKLTAFNNAYPFLPIGTGNELGNRSGIASYTMPLTYSDPAVTVDIPVYRGIKHLHGYLCTFLDGILVQSFAADAGNTNDVYLADDPANYKSNALTGYLKNSTLPTNTGYVNQMQIGERGALLPSLVGAASVSSSTYWATRFAASQPSSGSQIRIVTVYNIANNAGQSMLLSLNISFQSSLSNKSYSNRLTYIP